MESVMDALEQFKTHGYAEQLKTQITSDSIPLGHEDLLAFLYNQIVNIWHVLHLQFTPIHAELFCIMSQIFLFLLHLCVPLPHVFHLLYLYFQIPKSVLFHFHTCKILQ